RLARWAKAGSVPGQTGNSLVAITCVLASHSGSPGHFCLGGMGVSVARRPTRLGRYRTGGARNRTPRKSVRRRRCRKSAKTARTGVRRNQAPTKRRGSAGTRFAADPAAARVADMASVWAQVPPCPALMKESGTMARTVEVTELALRDGHQSLLATRMALEDMTPVCADIDQAGYWSVECWGGATYDACIRFLNEDPWERLRTFRKLLPNSRLQMLLRGQNLLGYRHYEDT